MFVSYANMSCHKRTDSCQNKKLNGTLPTLRRLINCNQQSTQAVVGETYISQNGQRFLKFRFREDIYYYILIYIVNIATIVTYI